MQESIVRVDNAMESIVRSLGRRIGEGKLAVGLLLELVKNESVRDCIGKVHSCIFLLVTLSRSDDNQAARDARDVLENLSFSDDNVIQMAKANYFKYLLQRLSSGSIAHKICHFMFEICAAILCSHCSFDFADLKFFLTESTPEN